MKFKFGYKCEECGEIAFECRKKFQGGGIVKEEDCLISVKTIQPGSRFKINCQKCGCIIMSLDVRNIVDL